MLRLQGVVLLLLLVVSSSQQYISRSGYIDVKVKDPIGIVLSHIHNATAADLDVNNLDGCWKDSYGRGVGRPIHACPAGMEKDAGLCYEYCRDGYKGVGPVCWEKCKPGYTDNGAFCGKSGEIISSNNAACPWYDICGLTFERGCSFCPDHNPPYANDGCTCRIDPHTYAKDSYGRGVGKPMGCATNEQYDAGLCYDFCRSNYYGVGPVCWQHCPKEMSYDYGAVCCTSKESCNQFIKDVSMATINAIAAAVEAGFGLGTVKDAIKAALEAAGAFVLMSCKQFLQ